MIRGKKTFKWRVLQGMNLKDLKVLILDCQTTGMRPSVGSLLELGWTWVRAIDKGPVEIFSHLCQLPEGTKISPKVTELTGLRDEDLKEALSLNQVYEAFQVSRPQQIEPLVSFIHYAQFEKSFLQDFFKKVADLESPPFEIFCTQQIGSRLLPQLPSRNIRALAGYYGHRTGELKRSAAHVEATAEIWKGLVGTLEEKGVHTLEDLRVWLNESAKKKKTAAPVAYEYRIDRLKRLALPPRPGIYRMLAKTGEVLYVGKATSLRDRVNSYFRGRKGRDPKKLEMLAQVWDLETIECESILEASLLETDEIKRLNPPYNISLKEGQRKILFYARSFEGQSAVQDDEHPLGPFRAFNFIEQMRWVQQGVGTGFFRDVFYQEIASDDLSEGFRIFRERENLAIDVFENLRSTMAIAVRLYRRSLKNILPDEEEDLKADDLVVEDSAEPLTPLEISEKFERFYVRAAAEYLRTKKITRLLNSKVRWLIGENWKTLRIGGGKIGGIPSLNRHRPWVGLKVIDYDRMCVLWSELNKHPFSVEVLPSLSEERPLKDLPSAEL